VFDLCFLELSGQHVSLLGEALQLLGDDPLLPASTVAPTIPTGSNVVQPHLLNAPVDRVRAVVVAARVMTPLKKPSGQTAHFTTSQHKQHVAYAVVHASMMSVTIHVRCDHRIGRVQQEELPCTAEPTTKRKQRHSQTQRRSVQPQKKKSLHKKIQ
jgi:hypothetical protein